MKNPRFVRKKESAKFTACLGIVLATVMGFTMGILRLSSNWLVN